MATDYTQVVSYNPSFTTKGNASDIAATGMEEMQNGVDHFSVHMANANSLGYMHNSLHHTTNGPHGEQVQSLQQNHFEEENAGPLKNTSRELDIALDGKGFFVFDASGSTDTETKSDIGFKKTGSMQLDSGGFLRDECGSIILGAPIDERGQVSPFNAFSDLQRVQISFTPGEATATTRISSGGILPADHVAPGDTRQSAVDVFDSLGIAHQLRLSWTLTEGQRLWQLQAEDTMGATLAQEPGGDAWSNDAATGTLGGCVVRFSETGAYEGTLPVTDPAYTTWSDANLQAKGGQSILDFMDQEMQKNPTITVADLQTATEGYRDATYPDNTAQDYLGADAVLTAALTGLTPADTANSTNVLTQGQTSEDTLKTVATNAFTGLETALSVGNAPPDLAISHWKNSEGNDVGSADSLIDFDISRYKMMGTQFELQTPYQDGAGSVAFKGIDIGSDGTVSLKFLGEESKPVWKLAAATFRNNNGLQQAAGNLLSETVQCGPFTLAAPTESNLGRTKAGCLTQSNVNPQRALMGTSEMARLAKANATIYGIANQTQETIFEMIRQSS